jgi:DNA replication and repair protein RecF
VLRDSRVHDRELGYTKHGIHRSDISFKVKERAVSRHYSRGQIKKYVACLILSQLFVMRELSGETPVFLVDDFAAEIDTKTRDRLVDRLLNCESQVFMTMTEFGPMTVKEGDITRFHVKHGTFNKMVE